MPPVIFDQIDQLPDVLLIDRFTLELGAIPGTGDGYGLTLRCQNAVWPGSNTEAVETGLHGHVVAHTGRRMWPHILSCSFIDTNDAFVTNTLTQWLEWTKGSQSGNSQTSKIGQVIKFATISVYSETGIPSLVGLFQNLKIEELTDVQLDGQQSAAFMQQANFRYDRFLPDSVVEL
jgi:hypothetical protein